jgi:hypothetical protein
MNGQGCEAPPRPETYAVRDFGGVVEAGTESIGVLHNGVVEETP